MKALKIIVLVLLSIVVIAYGVGFMVYRGVDKTLLETSYYHTVVDEYELDALIHQQIGDMVPEVVRNGLTGGATITDPTKKMVVDTQVDLISTAIMDALDEQWINGQAKLVTDDLVSRISGSNDTFTAVIDLSGKFGEIEQNLIKGLEAFSDAELRMFGVPRSHIPAMAQQIVAGLGLPESLVLEDLVNDMAPGTVEMITGYVGLAQTWFGVLAYVVFMVFLVLCLLLMKVSGGFSWFGVSAILSGLIGYVAITMTGNLERIESIAGFDASSLPIPKDVVGEIVAFTFSGMKMLPLVFMVVGLVALIVGILLGRKRKA